MTNQLFNISKVDWETNKNQLQSIRTKVFVEEQNVPVEEEWDSMDPLASHFLATDNSGNPVGTVRLLNSGQIGRMAVLKDCRGLGASRRRCSPNPSAGIRFRDLERIERFEFTRWDTRQSVAQ